MTDIARHRASEALDRFGLLQVDVWLRDDPGSMPLLAARSQRDATADVRGSAPSSIRERLDEGMPVLEGSRLGAPLIANEQNIGYVEFLAESKIALGLAAQLEAWTDELALAFTMQRATDSKDAPTLGSILIAEDDASIRRLLVTLLERHGFTASAVGNGQLAVERALEEQPDLILLDYMMPILDGRETAIRLRANPKTHDIPIIMVTSQAGTEEKVAALEAGAQDYVTKPFDSVELIARISAHLRWRTFLSEGARTPEPIAPQRMAPTERPALSQALRGSGEDSVWLAALHAKQLGRPEDALNLYLEEAERAEHVKEYARAAIAFRSASTMAGKAQKLDLSNKLLRLAGKMYLTLAENSNQAPEISDAYVNAAKCFLTAGNLQLAMTSVSIAESMNSVMADDEPSPIS